jgi:hypothetical protein
MTRSTQRRRAGGFTLLEMTFALTMTLGIAAMLIGILQQQVSFTSMLVQFRFLREEAPNINTLMTTMINKADTYRIYGSTSHAMAGTNAVQNNGKAILISLRNPDGTSSRAIITHELQGGANRLNYYHLAEGQATWPTAPSWTISSRPSQVNFSNSSGILLITMNGPDGEEITYAGNPH